MKRQIKRIVLDLLGYAAGSFIYSTAVTMFISGNEISPGGLTGIATLLNYLFSTPSGIVLFLLNIPILVLGFIKFGGIFIVKTSVATAMISLSLTITDILFPSFGIDKILAAVFGGILMGLGLSIIMLRGATSGGIDIIAKLINRRFRHFTVGRIMLMIDAAVIILAAFVYRNIQSALYSVISLYASARVMDMVLYGADKGKLIYIVTNSPEMVCKNITEFLQRGVTVINAKGGYTGKERVLLLCTVRRHEVSAVYAAVEKFDPSAFIVVSDAGEIIGEGFKALT